ncbi:hypothetical protein HHK36_014947 [Tetracentron sinense]|uniref:non-specific serine/threonine protein kinase n=1 Tax=Tetracentron sinense TaxID=13715 RepID=A0A834Z8D0_TETSI|nr:hypothetical protein HHK36_014947 [Tetracentron sinense]
MNPLLLSFIIIFFTYAPSSLCDDDERFSDCTNSTFDCGSIANIRYPFWGNDRPDYCGLPGFKLECLDGVPQMEIMSQRFQILDITQTNLRVMTIARMDFLDDPCPEQFENTTLDHPLFDYAPDNANLTLFYACSSPMEIRVSSRFTCLVNGNSNNVSYFVIGPVPTDPNENITKCDISVQVPILGAAVEGLVGDPSTVGEVLKEGFNVVYIPPFDLMCIPCLYSGGQCGYNWSSLEFTCFCRDKPYAVACPTPSPDETLSSADRQFEACAPRDCGNVLNISYPFWISDEQESYCGYPNFEITCKDSKPILTMSDDDYIIRDIFYKNHSILVANEALNTTCPTPLNNFTLDRTPFNYSLNHADIFFFYNCTSVPDGEHLYKVPCASNSSHKSVAVFVHEGGVDYWNYTSWNCQSSVSTPIDVDEDGGFEKIIDLNFKYFLKEGFLLNWTAMNCSECEGSGGRCGFDNSEFMCFCKDQPHRRSCNDKTSLCVDPHFEACKRLQNCGTGPNISYPFWIHEQQEPFCGYPGFEISCKSGKPIIHNPLLNISDDDHVIHQIFYQNQSLRIANAEALDNTCLPPIHKVTLQGTPFNFGPAHANLLLYLNCTPIHLNESVTNRISCASDNKTLRSLALFGDDPLLNYVNDTKICKASAVAPVDKYGNATFETRGYRDYIEFLRRGFLLTWKAPICNVCEESGGRCGFNATTYNFACFCPDRPHLKRCYDHKTRRWGFGLGVVLLFELLFSLMRDLGSSSMASYAFVVISFFLLSPFASHSAEEDFSHCKPFSCGTLTNISPPFSNRLYCGLSTIIQCDHDSIPMIELGREKYEVLEIFSNNKTIRIRDPEFIKHLRDKNCDELSNFTKPFSFSHLTFEVRNPNLTFSICKADPYTTPKQEFFNGVHGYRDCGALDLFFYDMNSLHDRQFEHLLGPDCDVVQFPVHELPSLRNGDLLSLLEAGFDLQWSLPPECQPCEHNGTFCLRNATGSFRCVDSKKGIAKKFSFLVVFFFFFRHCGRFNISYPFSNNSDCGLSIINSDDDSKPMIKLEQKDNPSLNLCKDDPHSFTPEFFLHSVHGFLECGDRDPFSYSLPPAPAPAPAPVPKFLGSDCPVVQFPKHDLPSHWEWNWRPDDLLPLLEPEFDLHWSIPPDSKCQPSERNGTICVGSSTGGFRCVDSKKGIANPLLADPYTTPKQEFFGVRYRDCGALDLFFYDMNSLHDWQFEHLLGPDCDVVQFPVHELASLRNGDLLSLLEAGFDLQWSLPPECQPSSHDERLLFLLFSGIASGFGGIILTCLLFFLYRRKQTIRQNKSKNISPSSTLLSENISSYTSSKLDLEKGSRYFGVPIFSYEELVEATDNFNPSKELGDGGFGTVYHGKLRDGRVVAVKRLYENNYKRVEQFMNEIEILTRLRHQNLVTLYGCTSRRSRELLLVYEYIPNGTVADHLHGDRATAGSLAWPFRMSIAIETAEALAYLHASDIIHRDVKTNNILLDNNFRVKVADFGLSRLFPTDVTHVSTAPQGTPGYVDPEYHQCYQLTDRSDVYSFGVVLIELISSKPAVDINRHRHEINLANMAINKIQNRSLHELVDPYLWFEADCAVRRMTTLVAELAFRCLQQDREMRPSMDEVLEVLRGIESEDYKVEKVEEVDIPADDVGLLKSIPPPLSPDSVTDNWPSRSTTPNASS